MHQLKIAVSILCNLRLCNETRTVRRVWFFCDWIYKWVPCINHCQKINIIVWPLEMPFKVMFDLFIFFIILMWGCVILSLSERGQWCWQVLAVWYYCCCTWAVIHSHAMRKFQCTNWEKRNWCAFMTVHGTFTNFYPSF